MPVRLQAGWMRLAAGLETFGFCDSRADDGQQVIELGFVVAWSWGMDESHGYFPLSCLGKMGRGYGLNVARGYAGL